MNTEAKGGVAVIPALILAPKSRSESISSPPISLVGQFSYSHTANLKRYIYFSFVNKVHTISLIVYFECKVVHAPRIGIRLMMGSLKSTIRYCNSIFINQMVPVEGTRPKVGLTVISIM